MSDFYTHLAALPLWSGPIEIEPLAGGMTNRNLLIRSSRGLFVARVAGDNAVHGIDRAGEQAATRAAAEAGLGPALVWAEPSLMILRHVEGRMLAPEDFADIGLVERVASLLRRSSEAVPQLYRGPQLDRRPIALLDHYARLLTGRPNRWQRAVETYKPLLADIERRLSAIPAGFAHNDVHGANMLDDCGRLWLLDWEYAGSGQAMVDVASLANNALLSAEAAELALRIWLGRRPSATDRENFATMRQAAALRDLFWGYAQDGFIEADPNSLAAYIAVNERRVSERLA